MKAGESIELLFLCSLWIEMCVCVCVAQLPSVSVQAVVSVQEVQQIHKWEDLGVGLKRGGCVAPSFTLYLH